MSPSAITTPIRDLVIIEPRVFGDDRGYFFESYNRSNYEEIGIDANFVQDNESCSKFGTLRGLHFQTGQFQQAKLVRVVSGKAYDIAVDIRPGSSSFGKIFGLELSAENKRQFFIPRGFAHGFVALSDDAVFQYKCDNYYNQDAEAGINYADPELKIDWQLNHDQLIINERDKAFPSLAEYEKTL